MKFPIRATAGYWPLLLLASCLSVNSALAQQGALGGEWRNYGGDAAHTKYSPLDQINADNVLQHGKRKVGSHHTTRKPVPPRQFQGEIEGARARIQIGSVRGAFPPEGPYGAPAPSPVDVQAQDVIQEIVARCDLAEERSNLHGALIPGCRVRGQGVTSLMRGVVDKGRSKRRIPTGAESTRSCRLTGIRP